VGHSATIESHDIIIPVKKPQTNLESKIRASLLPPPKTQEKIMQPKQNVITGPYKVHNSPEKIRTNNEISSSTHRHMISTHDFQYEENNKIQPKPVLVQKSSNLKPIIEEHKITRTVLPAKKAQTIIKPSTTPTQIKAASTGSVCQMTEEEKNIYGDRFPIKYKKISLLGKGGCALVWLGNNISTNQKVAVKQFSKTSFKSKSDIQSCYAEIDIGKILEDSEAKKHNGYTNIANYIETLEDAKDMWVIYELGGASLTKMLFEIKGEFYKGERIYKVTHQPFYNELKGNKEILKQILRKLLDALDLLQSKKIVHCDLKPDNLLITINNKKEVMVKIIDFGSAFIYGQSGILRMATPEYMPPECLELMNSTDGLETLISKTQPWSIDIWSIGAILLEIITGFPLWLSLKGRVQLSKKSITGLGVFAVQGKSSGKIIQKQHEVITKLPEILSKYESFAKSDMLLQDLLLKMLDFNGKARISPKNALEHKYFAS